MAAVEAGNVSSVVITGQEITGHTKDQPNQTFRTYAPAQYDGLANDLYKKNAKSQSKEPAASPWASLLYNWAPFLVMIGFWVFFMRQMQSGGNKALSFGKSKAKLSFSSQKKVTFKDSTRFHEATHFLQ